MSADKNDTMKDQKIDEVDELLKTRDGRITRTSANCRHSRREGCIHCLPLEPYDEEYLRSRDIKHMSFNAYVRKLLDGRCSGQPLRNENYTLQETNCGGKHKPYPEGSCNRCLPSTVTLNRQKFRHVDNITIENEQIVGNFLNYWRKSGRQRVGYLIGRYEEFTDVPLGIRALVTAIYEPKQSGGHDFVTLEALKDDEECELVDQLCAWMGLKRVGWVFTDLWSADPSAGTVHCTRHEDSYLFSASECITAGALQSLHKNYVEYCADAHHFGSKFVSVVASGDKQKQIHLSGYQVSNQCTAMVEARILCPTTANPELAWVRETPLDRRHHITKVQYTEKNEYGADVLRDGRPMPVEYLLVDVPVGTPKEPLATFFITELVFPIENRAEIGEPQSFERVARYVAQFAQPEFFLELASNFHFLLYLLRSGSYGADEVEQLARAVIVRDREAAAAWCTRNSSWQELNARLQRAGGANAGSNANLNVPIVAAGGGGSGGDSIMGEEVEHLVAAGLPAAGGDEEDEAGHWTCSHCTFNENPLGVYDCSICGLPME